MSVAKSLAKREGARILKMADAAAAKTQAALLAWRDVGVELAAVRNRFGVEDPAGWRAWLAEHWEPTEEREGYGRKWADKCIRLATHWPKIERHERFEEVETVGQALALIASEKPASEKKPGPKAKAAENGKHESNGAATTSGKSKPEQRAAAEPSANGKPEKPKPQTAAERLAEEQQEEREFLGQLRELWKMRPKLSTYRRHDSLLAGRFKGLLEALKISGPVGVCKSCGGKGRGCEDCERGLVDQDLRNVQTAAADD